MGAPIRSSTEIAQIITRAQHAIADLGMEIIGDAKRGKTITDVSFRDKTFQLDLLVIYLFTILDDDGNIKLYYQASANEKKFNKILDGIVNLAKMFDGPAIPLLVRKNLPLYFFPSTSSGSGGQQTQVVPGGTTFQNLSVNNPSEVVDAFDANISTFAFYTYSVSGPNSGEGNRSGYFTLSWKGSTVTISGDAKSPDVGGNTTGVTFSAAIVSGQVQLTCNVPTANWIVKGCRIVFQSISFLSQQGDFPNGIRTNPSGPFLKIEELNIGTWNMDASITTNVQLPVAGSKVSVLGVNIYSDTNPTGDPLNLGYVDPTTGLTSGSWESMIGAVLKLNRTTGGIFDNGFYDGAQNRGTVLIMYEI